MSLTSYRAAPPRGEVCRIRGPLWGGGLGWEERGGALVRSGGDLLSRVLGRSTISGCALNGRVRDGIGCVAQPMATRPDQGSWEAGRRASAPPRISQTSGVPSQGPTLDRACFRI